MPSGIWLWSYLALWFLLILESLALIGVVRQLAHLHSYWVAHDPAWGLPLGALAPELPGRDIEGEPVPRPAERGDKTLIYFLSPGCPSCRQVLEQMRALGQLEGVSTLLVVAASELKTKLFVAPFCVDGIPPGVTVLADPRSQLGHRYKIGMSPYGIVVGPDGRLAAKTAGITMTEIRAALAQADGRAAQESTNGGVEERTNGREDTGAAPSALPLLHSSIRSGKPGPV
jgi:hypothetical protein